MGQKRSIAEKTAVSREVNVRRAVIGAGVDYCLPLSEVSKLSK